MTDGEILLALGERDLEIMRAERALDELPEKTAILKLRHRIAEIERAREQADAYCRKADSLVSRAQDEAASVQDKAASEQEKVLSGQVTNPKELQNLTREIAALGRRRDALEHEALGLMEKAEAGRGQLAKVDAALAEGRSKEAALIERFKERGGQLQHETDRLRAERDALGKRLPADVLARYEAARASKHGIGVGRLANGVCSACRTQLPADRAQSLAQGPEIAECPNCRRVLVVGAEST